MLPIFFILQLFRALAVFCQLEVEYTEGVKTQALATTCKNPSKFVQKVSKRKRFVAHGLVVVCRSNGAWSEQSVERARRR
jgi:hypothetical protein